MKQALDENFRIVFNEDPLTESFIPTRMVGRDDKVKFIASLMEPALYNRKPENIYLFGPAGTGKTTIVKWIFNEHLDGHAAYVNCWDVPDSTRILIKILEDLRIRFDENSPTDKLLEKLKDYANKKSIVICLDEIDRISNFDLLYWLYSSDIGLVLISTKQLSYLLKLDQRIRARLSIEDVEMPRYSVKELVEIGKDRRDFSFAPNVMADEMIWMAAQLSDGDARIFLETLRVAGMNADKRLAEKVEEQDIETAVKKARRLRKSPDYDKLNDHEKMVLHAVEEKSKVLSSELYKDYCKSITEPVGQREFQRYMKHLTSLKFVKAKGDKRWRSYEIV